MNDFWNRAADAKRAREQQEQQDAFAASLRPVMPEHSGGTQAWIDVARARTERNRAATASSVADGYVNLSEMRALSHERAVQQYSNHRRLTDPAAALAEMKGGVQSEGYNPGSPRSVYSDIV
ncbi:hypothetical protein ACFXPT_11725 [Streptomyces goshikiensis]|uniref:hypothetical protein n=1 Tax=Streptomyces goshikiensis TaxID=1942 RepID=UPI0036B40A1A